MAGAQAKGSTLIYLKNALKEMGGDAEKNFLKTLNPEEEKCYKLSMPISWFPVKMLGKFYEEGANILFPHLEKHTALKRFGQESMKENMNGIYRLILKFMSVNQAVAQSAKTWHLFLDQGEAVCEILGDKKIVFKVSNFPELPVVSQDTVAGTIEMLLQLTGVKESVVRYEGQIDHAHRWMVTWQ